MKNVIARSASAVIAFTAAVATSQASAQSTTGYPVRPRPMNEHEEIALAVSAAPSEISQAADVWVLRDGGPAKARAGTNGCACMVSRDLHDGSLYPICFDREATRTVLKRELMELTLRAAGKSEEEVQRAITAAYDRGELVTPAKPAVAYMMSSRQVLFSSPLAEGRRVGAWSPHVMIYMPGATGEQFGLAKESKVTQFFVSDDGTRGAHFIVKVPQWADSLPPR